MHKNCRPLNTTWGLEKSDQATAHTEVIHSGSVTTLFQQPVHCCEQLVYDEQTSTIPVRCPEPKNLTKHLEPKTADSSNRGVLTGHVQTGLTWRGSAVTLMNLGPIFFAFVPGSIRSG